ncbi:hypothetical protein ACFL59_09115 [Planctomycetota bacterium]
MTQGRQDSLFGRIVLLKGYITDGQLLEALNLQRDCRTVTGSEVKLGAILYVRGFMTADQLHEVLDTIGADLDAPARAGASSLLGNVAAECGHLSHADLLRSLDVQANEARRGVVPRKLGSILLEEGYLSEAQLAEVLKIQTERKGA